MEPFRATQFMFLMETVGIVRAQSMWEASFPRGKDADVYDETSRTLRDAQLAQEERACIELELICSLATIRKMRDALAKPNSKRSDQTPLQLELGGRLSDEMQEKLFFSLSAKEAEYFKTPRNRWNEIIERFPGALSDVEEASKCFALSRYAASVFHSVQVVEAGLIELGKVIGVTDPQSGWTAITNRLQNIIKKGHEARTPFEQQHFPFLEQMQGTIEGLKNAWRNKVSHAQGKLTLLTADFSPDVAEEILFATRAFMRRLTTDAPVASKE